MYKQKQVKATSTKAILIAKAYKVLIDNKLIELNNIEPNDMMIANALILQNAINDNDEFEELNNGIEDDNNEVIND